MMILWKDDYALNLEQVDQQHQQLFDLANQLLQCRNKDDLAHATLKMFSHVREHFSAEEQFMREQHFPGLQQHIENHDLMLMELVAINEKVLQDDWQHQDIEEFMNRWVCHILDDDLVFKEYMQR